MLLVVLVSWPGRWSLWAGILLSGRMCLGLRLVVLLGRFLSVSFPLHPFLSCLAEYKSLTRPVYTLSTFSSVLLVTVTVTRKMFTMILSVVAFGHRLTGMQWLGVGLVFGGIGVEAGIARQEKIAKEKAKNAGKKAQ